MDNPKIEWVHISEELCLKFTFRGNFSEHDALKATAQWREALRLKPREGFVHIWNCLEMDDYDQEAKKIWIESCKEFRGQIDTVWLINNSLLINLGARIISLLMYLDIRIVQSEADIHIP